MRQRPFGAGQAPRDQRLDAYRGRGALLTNLQGERAGELFVDVEDFTVQVGGHLWWRRWSWPTEMLHGWVGFTDDTTTDFLIFDGLDDALTEWATGTIDLYGSQYAVCWLDDHGSQRLRDQYQPTQAGPPTGPHPVTPPAPRVTPLRTARLRSWVWSGLTATIGLLFAGVSVGAMLDDGRIETGGVIFVAVSLLVAARALALRVDLTADHLIAHSWLRNQRFPVAEIARLAPTAYDGLINDGDSRYPRQLRLTTWDGRTHDLRAVITWRGSSRAKQFCRAVNGRTAHGPPDDRDDSHRRVMKRDQDGSITPDRPTPSHVVDGPAGDPR